MKIVYCETGRYPAVMDIDGSLETMQMLVGGYIETMYIDDDVALVCNEEGKINGSEPNRFAFDKGGRIIDLIYGDFFLIGAPIESDNFASLKPEQIKKYIKQYGDIGKSWLWKEYAV